MKKFIYVTLAIVVLAACNKKDDDIDDETPNVDTAKTVQISLGASYANDIYYSFENGVVATKPRNEWHIGFSTNAMSSSILTNAGTGIYLYMYQSGDNINWNSPIDTTGFNWKVLPNSNVTWEEGAFGHTAGEFPDYGWGKYDMATHNLTGTAIFIIKLAANDYRKVMIESKSSAAKTYVFKYSNLDGSNSETVTLDCKPYASKNFVYYSLTGKQIVDHEPATSDWDIVFTKYYDEVMNYIVTGALSNIDYSVLQVDDVTDPKVFNDTTGTYINNIDAIGADWKSFNLEAFIYNVDSNSVFMVKNPEGNIHKLYFTKFDGSATGNLTMVHQKL